MRVWHAAVLQQLPLVLLNRVFTYDRPTGYANHSAPCSHMIASFRLALTQPSMTFYVSKRIRTATEQLQRRDMQRLGASFRHAIVEPHLQYHTASNVSKLLDIAQNTVFNYFTPSPGCHGAAVLGAAGWLAATKEISQCMACWAAHS